MNKQAELSFCDFSDLIDALCVRILPQSSIHVHVDLVACVQVDRLLDGSIALVVDAKALEAMRKKTKQPP